MLENKDKTKNVNSRTDLIVLGILAAFLTFLTIIWCIGYPDALTRNHKNPSMADPLFIGLLRFGLFVFSFLWLIEFCAACRIKAKTKATQIWKIFIAAYALLGLIVLWTVFLIVQF